MRDGSRGARALARSVWRKLESRASASSTTLFSHTQRTGHAPLHPELYLGVGCLVVLNGLHGTCVMGHRVQRKLVLCVVHLPPHCFLQHSARDMHHCTWWCTWMDTTHMCAMACVEHACWRAVRGGRSFLMDFVFLHSVLTCMAHKTLTIAPRAVPGYVIAHGALWCAWNVCGGVQGVEEAHFTHLHLPPHCSPQHSARDMQHCTW